MTKHGFNRRSFVAPEYMSYRNAKQRCQNPKNTHYAEYGARGIEFKFSSFEEFFDEIGPRPTPKHLYSLDRIRNNRHYEIGNVKWSTRKEQALNQRVRKDNSSGHKGIHRHLCGKWTVELTLNGKRIYLGLFTSLRKAVATKKLAVGKLRRKEL